MAEGKKLRRSIYCGKTDKNYLGKKVSVYGWVNKKREMGGLTFIDLRDREGILQLVFGKNFREQELLKKINVEDVICATGTIIERSNPNPNIYSGYVELDTEEIDILSKSETPPFQPANRDTVTEELRFKYRYLDLRDWKMQKNFKTRSKVDLVVRNYLDSKGFLNIETPMLTKATPEGARDYLVPSRIYKGRMFALPQSPQLFKQLLMVSGFERYFQIVKCFRDEDLRADRQPEFTQIDIEMSFAEKDELFSIVEGMIKEIFAIEDIQIDENFQRMPYKMAMENYGTDKPDLRIPYRIRDFSENSGILSSNILNSVIEKGGKIKGLVLPDSKDYSRKVLDNVNSFIKEHGGAGAVWLKMSENGFKSSVKADPSAIEKFFKVEKIDSSEIVFMIGGEESPVLNLSGKLRQFLGKKFTENGELKFLWVDDFPLFFYNEDEKRLDSNHHPFTSPKMDELEILDKDPLKVNSIAYDLVLNGVEIGGGSRRINDIALQKKIFSLLNLSEKEINEKFGFFLSALNYGAPPHLGIALGMDRIIMLLCNEASIREVIAFPKTTSSLCLLTGSPSEVNDKQLEELGIKFNISE